MKDQNTAEKESPPFEGFLRPEKNYFSMPNAWIDICAGIDNLAEMKVIQYVLRHTWGYQEYGLTKAITVDEFMHGRKYQDGKTRMDRGTGLKSDRSVKDGLKAAIAHGYLICEVDDTDRARIKKSYMLRMSNGEGCDLPPEKGQVDTTPRSGRYYPSGSQILPLDQVDTTPRSEKDTLERHSKKDTLERQGETREPAHESQSANPGSSLDSPAPSERNDDNNSSRTDPLATRRDHPPQSDSRMEARHTGGEAPGSATAAGHHSSRKKEDMRQAAAPGQGEATRPATQKGRGSAPPVAPPPAFTPEGQQVWGAWCSNFVSPPDAGPKTIECANGLHKKLVPWCQKLHISCSQLLERIRRWEFARDSEWFRPRGVTLCDIHRDFERWQSATMADMEQEAARQDAQNRPETRRTVSGLPRWVPPGAVATT